MFNGNTVSYDMDGNMLSDGCSQYKYDSANRLIKADCHTYTYNAEDVRIRNLCSDADTIYTYNTNCKLSQLLQKTTNGITTKYVYGLGLIGEEKENCFKTYHFDYRGSTVAITDINGNITDTFKYDTYGKLISRTGNSFVIFGYNGRDGVVTDKNGLIYMRARYYSPEMRRFINADVLHGEISDSTSLNRYSYVNGNPVSFVDPFGLWSLKGMWNNVKSWTQEKIIVPVLNWAKDTFKDIEDAALYYESKYKKYDYTFDNNTQVDDYKGTVIENQDNMSNYALGKYSIGDVGCEVVAVYNVMVLTGYKDRSFLNTIKTFEEQGALIGQSILKGYFGSNPYAISRVLDAKNIEYNKISSLDSLKNPGIYIVSYWNSLEFDSMIHTVAIQVNSQGKPYVKNASWDDVISGRFITGYEILEGDSSFEERVQKYRDRK